jgi:hypothetical protein
VIDTHREYHLVGVQNDGQEWVVTPRRIALKEEVLALKPNLCLKQ